MEILNMKSDDLKNLKLLESGSEAKLYLYKNRVVKLYEVPEEYDIKKIKYFCNIQETIKGTQLPCGVVIIDDVFSGCLQHYFKDYQELNKLNCNIPIERVIYFLGLFLNNYDELIQNKIYPIDLFYANVLFSFDKSNVQIIDLDGKGSIIKKEKNQNLLQQSLKLCLSTILESLYNDVIDEMWYVSYKSLLSRYPFKKEYIDIIMNNKLSLEFLYEFLEYIKKDEKNLFKKSKKLTLETIF